MDQSQLCLCSQRPPKSNVSSFAGRTGFLHFFFLIIFEGRNFTFHSSTRPGNTPHAEEIPLTAFCQFGSPSDPAITKGHCWGLFVKRTNLRDMPIIHGRVGHLRTKDLRHRPVSDFSSCRHVGHYTGANGRSDHPCWTVRCVLADESAPFHLLIVDSVDGRALHWGPVS